MNVRWWFNSDNCYFEFLYVYATYIQEPNSVSDMNVATRALDCIVLCQSFLPFNKYWRTHMPFYFSSVCFSFQTSVVHFDVFSSNASSSILDRFFSIGKTEGNKTNILQTLQREANILKDKQKRSNSILKNCFFFSFDDIKKATFFVLQWKTQVIFLPVRGNLCVISLAFLFILA